MGGTGYSAAGKAADGVSGFDALSLEARIGIIVGIVVFTLLVALAICYLKRKHATNSAVAGRNARDLEVQFVNDMVLPGTTRKYEKAPMRPMPTAAVREYRPRPRREESWGGSTVVAGGQYGRVRHGETEGIN
ncbi:hypothetical protein PG994_013887 [Apiospora phragmitis]|uniref:Transmembrane protein n=1 Tax=Apiospora phragmitis TaxID=2905665 RepID=A0ABR1T4J2_9PEZI